MKHYSRPLKQFPRELNPHEFWNLHKKMESGCWEYTGRRDYDGYGLLAAFEGNNFWRSARLAYLLSRGELPPEKMHVTHDCDNPSCDRPSHLDAKTHRARVLESISKGRTIPHLAKLNLVAKQIHEIRNSPLSLSALARKFGISRSEILHIRKHRAWAEVSDTLVKLVIPICSECGTPITKESKLFFVRGRFLHGVCLDNLVLRVGDLRG